MNGDEVKTEESADILWTEGALERIQRAPVFLRGMEKLVAEKKAK